MISSNSLIRMIGRPQNDPELGDIYEALGGGSRKVVEHLSYLDFTDKGVCFGFDQSARLETIFFFSNGHEGHLQYEGQLPFDLTFDHSQSKVHQELGAPSGFGGDKVGMLGTYVPPWDRYGSSSHSVTLQYNEDRSKIVLITAQVD
jgi:hypothetical protein